jgi:hypothetical protein
MVKSGWCMECDEEKGEIYVMGHKVVPADMEYNECRDHMLLT